MPADNSTPEQTTAPVLAGEVVRSEPVLPLEPVRGRKHVRRIVVGGAVVALCASVLTGCRLASTVNRPSTPVVLNGSEVPSLAGTAANRVVAFRHNENGEGVRTWTQIPVQVDQRKVVPFGSFPADNTVAGVPGTVYGSGSATITALQYADPNTWVGADTDPTLDGNDEIVFMASDAGGDLAADETSEPVGVLHSSGVAVHLNDPRGSNEDGWVYLFASTGTLDPAAGKDYVNYQFNLTSGAYKTTYKRQLGPNPETSKVTTAAYEVGFTDRWIEQSWKVTATGATGVDILDGHKNQFGLSTCVRSNVTFAAGEGAFIANIDGPVRAIRSYVGANSGPLTQRTHLMYRDRMEVVTNLRVHAIPGIMDFLDYSAAAQGMTYRSSTSPAGVTIDGNPDTISTAVPTWEAVNGPQGQVFTRNAFSTDVSTLAAGSQWFYRDQTAPAETQCWGDGSFLGASGISVVASIPNTDPSLGTFATLTGRRTTEFSAPSADPSTIAIVAAYWSAELATPLTRSIATYRP